MMWDLLWDSGRSWSVFPLGGGAFNSLRVEKGYRMWGADFHTDYNPWEVGSGWAVKLEKRDFVGRNALVDLAQGVPKRRLTCLTLNSPNTVVSGKEPVIKDDCVVGYVTSTDYGYLVGKHIAYAYLPMEHSSPGTALEIEYFGDPIPATVLAESLLDPDRMRLTN